MNPRRKFQLIGLASAGMVASALMTATPAAAQPVLVPCSATALQAAITAANTAGSGELLLTPGCTYSITTPVTGEDGLPQITGDIRVVGSGDTITRAPSATATFRLLDVASGGKLTLGGLTVSGGNPTGDGGGISNAGILTLNAVQVTKNSTGGNGGGVANTGTLNTFATRITDNTATTGGGGIFNGSSATAALRASSLDDNTTTGANSQGGGILNHGGSVTGDLSSLGSNSATGAGSSGGGIATVGGTVRLTLDAVTDNHATTAPGGILNNGGTVSLVLTGVFDNTPTNCAGSPSPVPGCFH
ncbi:hypothetical protein [Streptomyces silvisoli]|uniref:Right-handed parallel beta-helix repeat-containing protein n=1 Tax=Streptomyces silvisoli TaxID=3034235 RepID=A0ABT5ZFW7_9ACTN|nr:hypothetical protein [Streptomyces silvisoli]MDF3288718.1 hypothetical protein [Streptomyces silvisoli]